MNRIVDKSFVVKGAMHTDKNPFIALSAQLIENQVDFRCDYNKLNQIMKARSKHD